MNFDIAIIRLELQLRAMCFSVMNWGLMKQGLQIRNQVC